MAGEDAQETGRDGLHRAKRWLEMTTRVDKCWTHFDQPLAELLEFSWPHATGSFSFDLGGTFRGGDLGGKSFVAEVKNYKAEGDLPVHFRGFLAKAYVALGQHERRCDNFLWISWAPFQAQAWDKHVTTVSVQRAVLHQTNRQRVLGTAVASEASARLDPERLTRVADRTWLVTLSHQQEQLVLVSDHYLEVQRLIAKEGIAS